MKKCKYGCYTSYGRRMVRQFCPKHDKTEYDIKALIRLLLFKMLRGKI